MAVDFPNNPSRDELFFAEGTTWKWTGVAWAIVGGDGTPTEIVGADAPAGWQVWGDVLIQWGTATANATGDATVALPKAYKNGAYGILVNTINAYPNPSTNATVIAGSVGVSQFQAKLRNFAGAGVASEVMFWHTVGEAPDALKKAKVVHSANGESAGGGGASVAVGEVPPENPSQGDMWFATGESVGLYVWYSDEDSSQWVMTNGGGGTNVQEYLDPAGLKSWQIVGNKLECWGYVGAPNNGTGRYDVTFPKAFSGPVHADVTVASAGNFNCTMAALSGTSLTAFTFVAQTAELGDASIYWRATGKWGGVS